MSSRARPARAAAAPRDARPLPPCPPEGHLLVPPEFVDSLQDAFTRLGAATLSGALVGVNREMRGKPAGMRTHALVSLGAALVTLSSLYLARESGIYDSNPVTRAVQGIIAGVGFLGGGVILKTSDRGNVRNLTTAASIWVVACLGIVCGAGQWPLASAALLLTMFVLIIGGPVEGTIRRKVIARIFRRTEMASYRGTPAAGTEAIPDLDDDD